MKLDQKVLVSKYFVFLVMLYVVVSIVPGPFVYRLVKIHALLIPGGLLMYPLVYVISDILAEVYGYSIARLVIWCGLLCSFLFALFATVIIHLPEPKYLSHAQAYNFVFGRMLRIFLGNCVGVVFGRFLNIYCLTKWGEYYHGKWFFARSFFSSVIGEMVMLIMAATISLVGRFPMDAIVRIIFSDYLIRVVYIFVMAFPSALLVKYLKEKEGVHDFVHTTDFNPFNLSLDENHIKEQ
jgi:uncharacterized integral membrane protein (TIGR00697 family)